MSLSIDSIRCIARYYPEMRREPRCQRALTIVRIVPSLQDFYTVQGNCTGCILHITIDGELDTGQESKTPNEHVDVFLTIRNTNVIPEDAFLQCSHLQKIVIEEPTTQIGMSAFQACKMLEEVVLPDTLTYIGIGAFQLCTRLQRIHFGTSLETIDIGAFLKCNRLETIHLPDSITKLGMQAFHKSGLTYISIPESLTYIGNYAFPNGAEIEIRNILRF